MSVPEFLFFGTTDALAVTEATTVPLTLENGTVVGTATLLPDGGVEGVVTDPGVREKLACHTRMSAFSIGIGKVVVSLDGE